MAALASFRNNNPSPASPTNTAYSGISSYRTDSYKPIRDTKGAPAVPPIDARIIAKTHFDELNLFLESHMAKGKCALHVCSHFFSLPYLCLFPQSPPDLALVRARSSLDSLVNSSRNFRRTFTTSLCGGITIHLRMKVRPHHLQTVHLCLMHLPVPFLPVRDEFHPKRNQARQKLATLPKTRFKDLSSDVFVELGRRYPELKEPVRIIDLMRDPRNDTASCRKPSPLALCMKIHLRPNHPLPRLPFLGICIRLLTIHFVLHTTDVHLKTGDVDLRKMTQSTGRCLLDHQMAIFSVRRIRVFGRLPPNLAHPSSASHHLAAHTAAALRCANHRRTTPINHLDGNHLARISCLMVTVHLKQPPVSLYQTSPRLLRRISKFLLVVQETRIRQPRLVPAAPTGCEYRFKVRAQTSTVVPEVLMGAVLSIGWGKDKHLDSMHLVQT